MDSSRMRTACFLTVSHSIPSGGGLPNPPGLPLPLHLRALMMFKYNSTKFNHSHLCKGGRDYMELMITDNFPQTKTLTCHVNQMLQILQRFFLLGLRFS